MTLPPKLNRIASFRTYTTSLKVTFVMDTLLPFDIVPGERRPLREPANIKRLAYICKVQGTLVEVHRTGSTSSPPPSKGGRVIKGFSAASRLRLLKYLNKIDYDRIGESTFITLTYPDVVCPLKYADRSIHRYVFLRMIETKMAIKFPCVWRIEWEVRKSGVCLGLLRPHFHLACLVKIPYKKEQVQQWWAEIIGYRNTNLQVDVAHVTGFQGVLKYIAKYVSKLPTLDIPLHRNNEIRYGRHWGTTRKELIPLCEISVLRELNEVEEFQVMKVADEMIRHYDIELENGFTLFGINPALQISKICNSA